MDPGNPQEGDFLQKKYSAQKSNHVRWHQKQWSTFTELLQNCQTLDICPGEESPVSYWGGYTPGYKRKLVGFPKKCSIFNLNVNMFYNLILKTMLVGRTMSLNAFHVHFHFLDSHDYLLGHS